MHIVIYVQCLLFNTLSLASDKKKNRSRTHSIFKEGAEERKGGKREEIDECQAIASEKRKTESTAMEY